MAPARKNTLADEWMPLVEAAQVLGESRLAVLTKAIKGDLEAQHIAGRTVVSRASVDAMMAARK